MERYWTSADWLSERATISPQNTALIVNGREYSFQRLDSLVSAFCGYLTGHAIGRGDHIGMLMPNSLAAVCLVFSAARMGAVLIPLNVRLTPEELRWQITRGQCVCVLCLGTHVTLAGEATEGIIPVYSLSETAEQFETWLDSQFGATEFRYHPASPDSLQAILFTSGTTGRPKGAMITFNNHFWSAIGSAFKLGVLPEDRWLACLPLYHVGGLAILFRSCIYGTSVILQDGFDVNTVLKSLAQEKITLISLVPTMLGRLLKGGLSGDSAPYLRLILLGGAPAAPELLAQASRVSLPVAVTYGLTEACSQVATMMPSSGRAKSGSAGQPLFMTEIVILDETGREAPPFISGEISVKGPTVMLGYYDDPQATEAALQGGYLHTGDMGYKDDEGNLWVLDRRSDLIVSGGENVYPAEVERVLRMHPAVKAACVFGVPNADWGKQVAAIIVPHDGITISADELLAYSRIHLAGYKQPRVIYFSDSLPLTASGKVQRNKAVEILTTHGKSP